jgi:hypothetical protein
MKICYTTKFDFNNPCENEQLCKPPRRGGKKLCHMEIWNILIIMIP